jgi:glycosyltransferase involved in cell wall biosynthesis
LRIALDASYSLGEELTGLGVYSRELLYGLAASGFPAAWEWFYRGRRYLRAREIEFPANVTRRFLADWAGSRTADLFHGLNQRLPARRFRRQVATFHDLFVLSGEYSTPEFRARFARQAREAAERADLIVAVSAFTGKQVEALLGVPASRIRVVHHGVLPRRIPQVKREKLVLSIGAIQRRKNQAALVRAFAAMPQDWRLVLAGSNGFGAEETLTAVHQSPAKERISITGFISEEKVSELLGRASIFAFPSLDEGFGMPILEAMAAGVPVVTSNRSACIEVAENAGELVNPKSIEDLGDILARLAADEPRRNALITAGRTHAARFTWHRAVQETLNVYRELL